jgi:hypothetical protein
MALLAKDEGLQEAMALLLQGDKIHKSRPSRGHRKGGGHWPRFSQSSDWDLGLLHARD